ncbi:MAG: DUF5522 domain-containing protein [Bacteriovoracaceae bacterium]
MDSSYLDQNGNSVFTSHYLKARKTCCKTACLHCPYGHTIKKMGIQFQDFSSDRSQEAGEILAGHNKTFENIQNQDHANIKFIILKEKVIGLFVKNHIVIKEFYLKERFRDQDISRELVESYFFS